MSSFKDELLGVVLQKLNSCPEKLIVDKFKTYLIDTLNSNNDEVCGVVLYMFENPVSDKDIRCIKMLLSVELPNITISIDNYGILFDPLNLF